jgi:hypothetical protein
MFPFQWQTLHFFWYVLTTHSSIHVHNGSLHGLSFRAVGRRTVKQLSCVTPSVMPKGRQTGSAVGVEEVDKHGKPGRTASAPLA